MLIEWSESADFKVLVTWSQGGAHPLALEWVETCRSVGWVTPYGLVPALMIWVPSGAISATA
jgi:hypothetical protein